MVSSSLLHTGPYCTAVGVSNGCSDQPGPSPRCCPTGSQSAASRRVPSVTLNQRERLVSMRVRQTVSGCPQRLHRRLGRASPLQPSAAERPPCAAKPVTC